MSWIAGGSVLSGAVLSNGVGVADLEIVETESGISLFAVSHPGVGGGITSLQLTQAELPTLIDQMSFAEEQVRLMQSEVSVATINGETVLLLSGYEGAAAGGLTIGSAGELQEVFTLSSDGTTMNASAQTLLAADVNGSTLVFASDGTTGGVRSYRLTAENTLQLAGVAADDETTYLADVADFATVEIGSQTLLLSVSSTEPGLTAHRINLQTGALEYVDAVGSAEGLGMAGSARVEVAVVAGTQFAIIAGTNSSSLTIVKINSDGSLTPTDHIIDSLDTRFANLTAIEVIECNGWTFVIAGGGDDGVSVFALLPDGSLVYLQSMVDTNALTLENVSALAAAVVGDELQIYAASGTEEGLTQLTMDASSLGSVLVGHPEDLALSGGAASDMLIGSGGNDVIYGNGGNDIIKDGAGVDTLYGGAGQDIFVLSMDGATDTIQDFEAGVDRLDLSNWTMLYGTGQLSYQVTAVGAILRYRGETLVIISNNGAPLSLNQIFPDDISGAYRPPMILFDPGFELIGTESAESLTGAENNDTIYGLAGNDTLSGAAGEDMIYGGAGSDVIYGGPGDDYIEGGDLFDTIYGGSGNDRVYGGNGVDTVVLGDGNDLFFDNDQGGGFGIDWVAGGNGNDHIVGRGGADALLGGNGHDTVFGGADNDRLWGHSGNDQLFAGDGDDTVWGGDGENEVHLGAGDDTYYAPALNNEGASDTIYGNAGRDRILSGAGDDVINAGADDDEVFAGDDNDSVEGGGGDDTVHGGNGNDTVSGGSGRDTIFLNAGDDVFYDIAEVGFAGSDRVFGHGGNDTFHGGGGNDTLHGGSGSDTFIFYTGNGRDTIGDFTPGEDAIEFRDLGLDFDDLVISQSGTNTIIDYVYGELVLIGVAPGALSADDFIFI